MNDIREVESSFGVLPIPVVNEGDPYLVSCNTWLPSVIGARQNFVSSYASLQTKAESALAEFIASCRGEN